MAKLVTMFLILIALQASLLIYASPEDSSTSTSLTDSGNTSIWNFIMNMDNWNSLTFILALVGISATIAGAGIAAQSFGFKTDFLLLAVAIPGFITMGVIFVNFARVLRSELISWVFTDCSLSSNAFSSACNTVNLIVGLSIGVIAFYYVWTIFEWWRGKDY